MKLWLLSFFLLLPMFDAPIPTDTSRSEAQAETGRQELQKHNYQKKVSAQPKKEKKQSQESFGQVSLSLGVLVILWLGLTLVLQSPSFVLWLILGLNILGHILALILFFSTTPTQGPPTIKKLAQGGCIIAAIQMLVTLGFITSFIISHSLILAANVTGLYIMIGIAFVLLLYTIFDD